MSDRSFLLSKKIRILVNALHAKSGGGVTFLNNLLPKLAEMQDFELHLLVTERQYKNFSCIQDSVRLHIVPLSDNVLRLLLWEQFVLPLVAYNMSVDVVLSPANYGPLLQRPHLIVLQNSLAVGACEKRWSKKLYWSALSLMTTASLLCANTAVAVSKYVALTTTRLPSPIRSHIPVIYHGVSTVFHPSDDAAEDFLLAVGDLYVQKNFETLIKALPAVFEKNPTLHLKIAGRPLDKEYTQNLYDLIDRLNIKDKIIFLGHCYADEIAELYRKCVVFVFPSVEESFGMPVVEAMASGCAIACSNAAAMPEIAEDSVRYFNPLSSTEIAAAIQDFLVDPDLRAEYRRRAIERAKCFRWETAARQFAELLIRIAPKRHQNQ